MEKRNPPLQKRDHTWKVPFCTVGFLIDFNMYKRG